MKKTLEVKEWFAKKIADEKAKKFYDVEVYAVLRETEKAVELVFASDTNGIYTAWCPKSQLIIVDRENRALQERSWNRVVVEGNLEEVINTMKCNSFADACKEYNGEMVWYR